MEKSTLSIKNLTYLYDYLRQKSKLEKEPSESDFELFECMIKHGTLNKDACAIYSLLYPPTQKRYTIEFGKHKEGTFYIIQIQGKCNRGCPEEVKKYVTQYITA